MNNFNFSCSGCGKCCEQSPFMIFTEIIENADKFVFQVAHHAILSSNKEPIKGDQLNHYEEIAHTIKMPELDSAFYYFIDFATIDFISTGSCGYLKDKQCSIYADRPLYCQLMPLNPYLAESKQDGMLNVFRNNIINKDWKCKIDEIQPIIWREGEIIGSHNKSIYHHYVESIKYYTDRYIEFLSIASKEHIDNHFKAVFQSVKTNVMMISDMNIALQVAIYNEYITKEQAIEFIQKQIKLIDQKVECAIKTKAKIDRSIVDLYRRQKLEYNKAIGDGIYDYNYDDGIVV